MGLYKVTTLVQFKHVYYIEGKKESHALDEVTMRESGNDADYFDESGQQYLGETIIDSEEVTRQDFEQFLDKAKKESWWSSHWLGDALIRKIDYDETPKSKVTINVHDNDDNMGFEGTVTITTDTGHEVFKQLGTNLILGKPDIGAADTREASRYNRWTRHQRGY